MQRHSCPSSSLSSLTPTTLGLRCLPQEQTALRWHRYVHIFLFVVIYELLAAQFSTLQQLVSTSFLTSIRSLILLISYYASKQCTYTDAAGRAVPAPRSFKPETQSQQHSLPSADPRNFSQPSFPSSSASNQFRVYPKPSGSLHQCDIIDDEHKHARKRFRNERGNPLPIDDLVIEGPISTAPMDRPNSIDLDPALTRELTNCKHSCRNTFLFYSDFCLQYFSPIVTRHEPLFTNRHSLPPSATTVSLSTSSWQYALSQRPYQSNHVYAQHPLGLRVGHSPKKHSHGCLTTPVGSSWNRTLQPHKHCVSFRCMTFLPTKKARSGAPVFMVLITFASHLIVLIGRSRSGTSNR